MRTRRDDYLILFPMVLVVGGRRLASPPQSLEAFFATFPEVGENNTALTQVRAYLE